MTRIAREAGLSYRQSAQRIVWRMEAREILIAVDEWTDAAKINTGALFGRVSRPGKIWGEGLTRRAIWHLVKAAPKRADVKNLAPHDLRRTCARRCHLAGGELEQIQFLLGHASVQTTEHYLGCKQAPVQPVLPVGQSLEAHGQLRAVSNAAARDRYTNCRRQRVRFVRGSLPRSPVANLRFAESK
jgi:Phage integrase family